MTTYNKLKERIKELEEEKSLLIDYPNSMEALAIKYLHNLRTKLGESAWFASPLLTELSGGIKPKINNGNDKTKVHE